MKIEPSITKEAVNELPISSFQGDIIIVDSKTTFKSAISHLQQETILGLDTETKPAFKKGVTNKVALVQISTESVCYLFRLNKIGFPKELLEILTNPQIKKIGLSLRDDFLALKKRKPFIQKACIDLQDIVEDYGIAELSLQKVFAILFQEKISKSQRLSNWESDILTEAQQKYAATDAWATRRIYLQLMDLKNAQ